ncbi:MAG: ATP-binding protein [Acidobacteriota bacterium]|nr:ATP-binding protein [Acidobacteriota bacterium]
MNDQEKQSAGSPIRWNEELRGWLEGYIKRYPHHTTEILSRSQYIGISRRALDAYLAGTYFLPKKDGGEGQDPQTSTIENSIRVYRERVEGTIRYGYANTFKRTRVWEQVGQACDVAINENVIVVVYGRPGIGKSHCLTEYALPKMRTAPITVLCSRNITPRFFIQKLAKELRIERQWTIPDLEEAVAEQLTRYPRPLFIDQANFLHERSLGTVCHLWELARIMAQAVHKREEKMVFSMASIKQRAFNEHLLSLIISKLALDQTAVINHPQFEYLRNYAAIAA